MFAKYFMKNIFVSSFVTEIFNLITLIAFFKELIISRNAPSRYPDFSVSAGYPLSSAARPIAGFEMNRRPIRR